MGLSPKISYYVYSIILKFKRIQNLRHFWSQAFQKQVTQPGYIRTKKSGLGALDLQGIPKECYKAGPSRRLANSAAISPRGLVQADRINNAGFQASHRDGTNCCILPQLIPQGTGVEMSETILLRQHTRDPGTPGHTLRWGGVSCLWNPSPVLLSSGSY